MVNRQMQIFPVRFDNIVDNQYLIDDNGNAHPATQDCLPAAFANADAVCLDFTSVSISNREVFSDLLQAAKFHSTYRNKPLIMMPLQSLKSHLGQHVIPIEALIPLLVIDDDGNWRWYGPAEAHAGVLDELLLSGKSLTRDQIVSGFGEPSADFVEAESRQNGGYVELAPSGFQSRIRACDIAEFLRVDAVQKIEKGLRDSDSLLTYNHFIIDDSGIHTDAVLLVERLLRQSSRSVDKLLVKLREKTVKLNYHGVICGPRLDCIRGLIGAALDRNAITLDPWQQVKDQPNTTQFPRNSRVIIVDSFARSGNSVSRIANMAAEKGYQVVAAVTFFGSKPQFWLRDSKCECTSLIHLPIHEWTSDCPLCALGIPPTSVTREGMEQFLHSAEQAHHTTAYHFWNHAIESGCVDGNGTTHLIDDDHHLLFYLDIERFLAEPAVRQEVAYHLYARLRTACAAAGMKMQHIRHIVYKDTSASRRIAGALSQVIDGWTLAHPVKPDHVKAMRRDPQYWEKDMYDLARNIREQGGAAVLVDDGINSGCTLSAFARFFDLLGVNHVATAVVVNRSTLFSAVEYYQLRLPTWHRADCPVCSRLERLDMLAKAPGLPGDVVSVISATQAADTPMPLRQSHKEDDL